MDSKIFLVGTNYLWSTVEAVWTGDIGPITQSEDTDRSEDSQLR